MTTVHLTLKSSNAKTGPIPVSTTSANTCPDKCPLKSKGCYAKSGPLALHWAKVTAGDRGESWKAFLQAITHLPAGTFWRHNQAGDLPGNNNRIDGLMLSELVKANSGKRGFTYTHKPIHEKGNLPAIRKANRSGFTINLSGNSLAHADQLMKTGLPVVTLLPARDTSVKNQKSPAGNLVVTCPATRIGGMSCDKCRLCSKADRGFIIGFPAHGTAVRTVDELIANTPKNQFTK